MGGFIKKSPRQNFTSPPARGVSVKKTILLSIFALAFAFTSLVKAEMSLSGYTEFFAGSADQSRLLGADNQSGIDNAGLDNGN